MGREQMTSFAISVGRLAPVMLGLATALLWPASAVAQAQDPIVQLLERDAIPAIHDPRFVPSDQATLRPDEKVLGLVVGGEARAYPLIDMDRHEIVDDVVGGTPVAATW